MGKIFPGRRFLNGIMNPPGRIFQGEDFVTPACVAALL